jgi:hypothetical protein
MNTNGAVIIRNDAETRRDRMADRAEKNGELQGAGEMEFSRMGLNENQNDLLKEIKELENEIEEIEKRIPPHSVRYEIIQLLEEKEEELKRKRELFRLRTDVKRG